MKTMQLHFKKVPFYWGKLSSQYARRKHTHEFPSRDIPYTEDLGLAAREFSVDGYYVGDNVQSQLNALIKAVETRGDGLFTHPTQGDMLVACKAIDVEEEEPVSDYIEFKLTFVQQGELAVEETDSLLSGLLKRSRDLIQKAQDFYAGYEDIINLPDYLAGEIATTVEIIADTIDAFVAGPFTFINGLNNLRNEVNNLVNHPERLAGDLVSLIDLVRYMGGYRTDTEQVPQTNSNEGYKESLVVLQKLAQVSDQITLPEPTTPNRQHQREVLAALLDFVEVVAIANATMVAVEIHYESLNDVMLVRDQLLEIIENTTLTTTNDLYFLELTAIRSELIKQLPEISQDLPSLITVKGNVPALVLAYDLYDDPERADEIAKRNGVLQPAFLPTTVTVLNA